MSMFKDPVCKMTIDEDKAQHVLEVGGRKIYLCSAACKDELARNPKKYFP